MSIYEMSLDLKKSLPIYNDPIALRQDDTNVEILVHVFDNSTPKNLGNLPIEFHADKPDGTTIEDKVSSHFSIQSDNKSFIYSAPDELVKASGSTKNTYFKIGQYSTPNFYIHILTESGIIKSGSGDYISRVDEIFNHISADYEALEEIIKNGEGNYNTSLEESKKGVKDFLDQSNTDYVNFINEKTTDFNTFLNKLDTQANDLEDKYTALKTQLDALEVPDIGGRNYLLDSENYNKNYWLRNTGIFGDVLNDSFNGTKIVQTNVNWGGPKYSVDNLKERGLLDDTSQSWTLSAYARTTTNVTAKINFYGVGTEIELGTVGQNWKRISVTFKFLNPDSTIRFEPIELDKVPAVVQFSGYKLEKGNISTDWTPAPEDKMNTIPQLGIRNLLSNTKNLSNIEHQDLISKDTYNGNAIVANPYKDTFPNTDPYVDAINVPLITKINNGYYTLSFIAWSDNEDDEIGCYFFSSDSMTSSTLTNQGYKIQSGDGEAIFKLTTKPTRYWVKWKNDTDDISKSVIIGRVLKFGDGHVNKGTTYTTSPMLVEGTIPASWIPAPEDIVNKSDTNNWQKQKITQDNSYYYAICNNGTDFGEFLKSDKVPIGLSIIRNSNDNSPHDWQILKENMNYIYGLSLDASGNFWHIEVNNSVSSGIKNITTNLIGKSLTLKASNGTTTSYTITGID